MAWRIDTAVIRGEIDNRTRGRVTGRIWFVGRPEPVELELEGNCWRDLAGRRLEFVNPQPEAGELEGLSARQRGPVGDITASRKVKVPEIPLDQIGEYYAARKPFPWHWGNSLYLEWFSRENGRVVIESAGFELKITAEAAWEMSPEEETSQRERNGAAMTGFMDRLGKITPKPEEEFGEREGPQTEAEAEAMQARSDLLASRVEARLRREGDDKYEEILEEEIDRMRRERGEPEPTPEQEARAAGWVEEMNRIADDVAQNPDPEWEAELERRHPLAERTFEFSLQLHKMIQTGRLLPENATQEHPVAELDFAVMSASAKLAGALNGEEWPPAIDFCAGVIVRLKRARGYLDDALSGAEACGEQRLLEESRLGAVRAELNVLGAETDGLIGELRALLARGFD